MNSEDKSRWACVAQPRLPSSGFDHVAVGRVLDDACLSPCVLAATPSTLHLFRVNLPINAEGENQGLLVPLCSVSIFAQISGIACVPGGRQNSNQPTLKADNFIVLLRNGFIGLYRYEGTSNRLQACCWTPTILALKENDHAVCLAINTAGKIAVVSKLGQVFAAELDITEEGTCLTLSNRVEFSALIMTKELEVVRSTQMFSKYHAVTCAQWGEYTFHPHSHNTPRSVEALWLYGACTVDETDRDSMTKEVSCSYLPFWYLEAPRALSIEAMLGFAFPLTPPFQHKLVFADSSSRLCVGEPVISWKAEVPETEGLQARPRRAGKWTLESSTFVQQVSFHGQSFQHESQLIAAAVGTVPGAALMMVLSNGELFIGDVTNCEMSRCKTALEMVVGNVASLLPLTGDLSALVCLTDSGELHILKRADEDGNVPLQNNSDNQATVPDLVGTSTCPLYGTAWSSERGVGKLVDAAPIQQGNSVMMLTIHDGASVASNQPLSFCRNKSKQASLLTWSPDPVPELLFEGIPGEAENVTSMWALQNDRGYDAAIIISSSSGTRIVEADSKGTFIDVTDDVVELDSGSETLAAGNISTSGGWAAQVTGTAVIAFKPFDRSIISAKKWFVPSNFHIGAVTVTGGTVVMHVLIDGSNHLLLLRLEAQVNVASDESSSDECQASWTIMSDMPLEHEASCISNVISGVPLQTNSGCHLFLGVGTYKPSILLIRISCTCNSWAMDIVDEFLLCSPTSNGRSSVTKMAVDPRHSSDYTGEKDVVLGLPAMLILQPSPLKVTPAVDDVQPLRMIDVWMTLRNGVFQHVRCSMNASSGGVSWSPVYKISDSGSVPPAMLLLPQQSTAGSSYSVMTMTTDAATLYSTLQDSAGIDFIRLKLPFAMLNIALPLNLPSNDSSMNSFLTCRQDGALCLLSLNPPVESHIVSKLCPLPDAFVPTGLFASKLFAEFSHIVCVAGYELEQSGKRLPGLALFNTVRQEIITRLECAKKSSTLGCWMLGSLLPFFSELIVTSAEFLPTEAVEAGKRRRNSASTNLASSGYLLVVLSDPGALRWLFRNFKTQEFSWLVMFRFQNCVPDIPSDPSSRLELCGVHRFTDPVASMCVAHPDMWLPGKLGEDLDPFKRPLAFVAVASRLVAYEIQYHPSNLGHDQIKFEPKTWYQTVDNVTSLSPLQDVVLAGSMAGVVAYGFKNIEGESMDATDVRDLKYLITFSRCSVTARPIKDLIPADAKGAHVLMGLEIGTSGRVSVFKYKANGNDEKTVMQEWMPQVTVGEPGLGMKCLPIARIGDGTEPRTLYMCTQHRGMWRFQMRELDSRTVETVLAIQKEASRHFAVGGCCYEDFRLGGNRSVYINPMPDVHDEADAGKPPAIVISRDFVETNEGDAREAINGPESSSSIISVGDDKQGGALLDGELLNAFVTAPLTIQEEILYKAGLLERGNSIGHDGAERLFSVTAFVIDVWNCIRS